MHAHLPTETAKGKIKMLVFTPILASAILKASMRDGERERLEREYWSRHQSFAFNSPKWLILSIRLQRISSLFVIFLLEDDKFCKHSVLFGKKNALFLMMGSISLNKT